MGRIQLRAGPSYSAQDSCSGRAGKTLNEEINNKEENSIFWFPAAYILKRQQTRTRFHTTLQEGAT